MRKLLLIAMCLVPAACQPDVTPRYAHSHAHARHDRTGPGVTVTRGGRSMSLSGNALQAGDAAPPIILTDARMQRVDLGAMRGRPLVISVAPALETPVCSDQCRRFDAMAVAGDLGPDVQVVNVTTDLPFVQERWAQENPVQRIGLLSDAGNREFGRAYGVLIEDTGVLARSVFVVDAYGMIRYVEVSKDLTHPPNYLEVARQVARLDAER